MPRQPRLDIPGIPQHVVQRGNDRQPCFFREEDYLRYLQELKELALRCQCAVHAYVLMTNHVHLLLTPKKAQSVPKLLISLGRRYVQYVNTTYRRTGTLWDSRYKSSLIQAETYLLECMRYIEMNPVRAAMVEDPAHYRWSSYRANGLGQADALIAPHALYLALGRTAAVRLEAYRALFRAHLDQSAIDDIRLALNQNQPLGNSRFYSKIARMTGERRQARPRGRPKSAKVAGAGNGQGELGL